MSSNTPVVIGKASLFPLVVQVVIIALLYLLFDVTGSVEPFLFATLTYLVLSRLLRSVIAGKHRKGIRLVMKKKHNEAIVYFEQSYHYFVKHPWLDKYRFLTMLSAAKSSYTQMALNNIAFCYGQIGNRSKAIEFYNKALVLNADDGLARAGLNMLQAKDLAN